MKRHRHPSFHLLTRLHTSQLLTHPDAYSHLLTHPHTSSHVLAPPHTSSHVLTPPQTSSHLLTPPYTSSHLLTPPHASSHVLAHWPVSRQLHGSIGGVAAVTSDFCGPAVAVMRRILPQDCDTWRVLSQDCGTWRVLSQDCDTWRGEAVTRHDSGTWARGHRSGESAAQTRARFACFLRVHFTGAGLSAC